MHSKIDVKRSSVLSVCWRGYVLYAMDVCVCIVRVSLSIELHRKKTGKKKEILLHLRQREREGVNSVHKLATHCYKILRDAVKEIPWNYYNDTTLFGIHHQTTMGGERSHASGIGKMNKISLIFFSGAKWRKKRGEQTPERRDERRKRKRYKSNFRKHFIFCHRLRVVVVCSATSMFSFVWEREGAQTHTLTQHRAIVSSHDILICITALWWRLRVIFAVKSGTSFNRVEAHNTLTHTGTHHKPYAHRTHSRFMLPSFRSLSFFSRSHF